MPFKPVSAKLEVPAMEEALLKRWKREKIFEKTLSEREGGKNYVFYEGPPTANGKPGVHHVLARAFKDMFPRYKTMQGYYVSRRGGWDTHGLPVEIEIEKRHGFVNKQQIENYGIAKFNQECRKSAFDYIQDWERLSDRIAFWADYSTAYVTYENNYIESVWWILKELWQKSLLYQGYKVVPYCPRCGTPLSDHEVALGYEDTVDPSIFFRLPLVDEPGTSLLVWTTTPWTLPANVAVAASPEVDYVKVENVLPEGGTERLILAKDLVEDVFREAPVKILETFKGKKLKGMKYRPLFTFIPSEKPSHFVVMGDFVTTEDGTGLVHIAPAFGADDMKVSQDYDLPVIMTVAPDGTFVNEVTPWRGIFVKDADEDIKTDLDKRGLMFRAEGYKHSYPFCWRCKTPLLYYAREAWYIRTSQFKQDLVDLNKTIYWVPEHLRDGRFGNWLENNIDWALSRERYWGTPLPVWECKDCGHQHCIGAVEELSGLAGRDLTELDLHRPYVDEVYFPCQKCGGKMKRVNELIDVWFDSGSMPYAQWHYPFENKDKFEAQYPADFICEAVDQTRGWFYSLHAISTMLFKSVAFKNVVSPGHIQDADGRKMSKSLGNIVQPWDVLNVHGADALRWYLYTATPPGNERRFSSDLVGESLRNFTLPLWNVYSFFVTYSNLDGWEPAMFAEKNLAFSSLDKWLLSELNVLIREVTEAYEKYDPTNATRPVEKFVEILSTWYVRRSRRRFWKSESDSDKKAAYATLYHALVTISKLIAPAMPFLADEIYSNLVRGKVAGAHDSVHLESWPNFDETLIDEKLNREMELVMKLASLGHAARSKANRKVRQPLSEVAYSIPAMADRGVVAAYEEILLDELNVKKARLLDASSEALTHTVKALPRQLGQKYGNKFPALQKQIMSMDPDLFAIKMIQDGKVNVQIDGENYEILPDETEIKTMAKEGFSVAEDGAYVAALVTELSPELIAEGTSREIVRKVQDFRKDAGLEMADRIRLYVICSDSLRGAINQHKDYIMNETLTVDLNFTHPPQGAIVLEDELEGEKLVLGLEKSVEK
ncbi:MAG TPA: isoleucine--tRNA ligase [Anaerolineales bacterium]|nr:isoleucine--tRNA ligase [Anaerolineales bacterium]